MKKLFFIAITAMLFASCGNQTAEAPKEKKINGDSLLKVVNDFDANIKAGNPIVKMSRVSFLRSVPFIKCFHPFHHHIQTPSACVLVVPMKMSHLYFLKSVRDRFIMYKLR